MKRGHFLRAYGLIAAALVALLVLPAAALSDDKKFPFDRDKGDMEAEGPGKKKKPIPVKTIPALPKADNALPKDGVIMEQGMLTEAPNRPPGTNKCDCSTVFLGRVTTKLYTGMQGNWTGFGKKYRRTYNTSTHFNGRGRSASGGISVRSLKPKDMVCFYFNYPRQFAWMVRESKGRGHPCRTLVEIQVPHNVYGGKGVWQLYTIRGGLDLRTATRNSVCRVVAVDTHRIGPGKGYIRWEVNREVCKKVNLIFK